METVQQTETFDERIARERREALTKFNARNTEVLPAIAKALGWKFTPEPEPKPEELTFCGTGWFDLTKSGCTISLRFDQYGQVGRIELFGHYPRAKDNSSQAPYNAVQHRITVAETKEPAQVANDIAKRLLPDFLKDWESVKKNCDDHDAKTKNWAKTKDRLVKAGDLRPDTYHDMISSCV